jgi:hypothetical protein
MEKHMEIAAGLITAIAALVLVLGPGIGKPGGLSTSAKMLAGGALVAGGIVLLALVFG